MGVHILHERERKSGGRGRERRESARARKREAGRESAGAIGREGEREGERESDVATSAERTTGLLCMPTTHIFQYKSLLFKYR
jgi:hypothetical protein